MSDFLFSDRASAGRLLAREVAKRYFERPVVYALPRGGVPVAAPIAAVLNAPLDLLLVRKIGVPRQPEVAAASIVDGERPDIILNERIVRAAGLSAADLDLLAEEQLKEIERRRVMYLGDRAPVAAGGRTAILVDDGIATGASMRVAIAAIRRRKPLAVVVAIPVASREAVQAVAAEADQVICLATPADFSAVGSYYEDFHQLEDGEVVALLAGAHGEGVASDTQNRSRAPQ
ncbi:MAG: phosphoribosyltransferase family protein [Hyphomonadaceae bacterium]